MFAALLHLPRLICSDSNKWYPLNLKGSKVQTKKKQKKPVVKQEDSDIYGSDEEEESGKKVQVEKLIEPCPR